MNVAYGPEELKKYLQEASKVSLVSLCIYIHPSYAVHDLISYID